ncbi:f-box protein [Cystoisospora suis]|uniref:F-box protein n=1 Tax=Cystoisospora suis TaxID=483139 RepID=A0A2C6L7K0_9APIC|nr:f-box protein [Cystoisospora suis]
MTDSSTSLGHCQQPASTSQAAGVHPDSRYSKGRCSVFETGGRKTTYRKGVDDPKARVHGAGRKDVHQGWQKEGGKPCPRRVILNEDSFLLQVSGPSDNVSKSENAAGVRGAAGVRLRRSVEETKPLPQKTDKTDCRSRTRSSGVDSVRGIAAKDSHISSDRGGNSHVRHSRGRTTQPSQGPGGSERKNSTPRSDGLCSHVPATENKMVCLVPDIPFLRGKRRRTDLGTGGKRPGNIQEHSQSRGEGRGRSTSMPSLTDELPDDILSEILCYLPFTEVGTTIPLVSRTFCRLALHPYIWTFFYASAFSPSTPSVRRGNVETPASPSQTVVQSSSVREVTPFPLSDTATGMVGSETSGSSPNSTSRAVEQLAPAAGVDTEAREDSISLSGSFRGASFSEMTINHIQTRQSNSGRVLARNLSSSRCRPYFPTYREKNASAAAAFAAAAEEICFVEMEAALRLEREKSALLLRQSVKKRRADGYGRQDEKGGEQTLPPRAVSAFLAQCHVHRLQRLHALREKQEMLKQQKAAGGVTEVRPMTADVHARSAFSGVSLHHLRGAGRQPGRRESVRRRGGEQGTWGQASLTGTAGLWPTGSRHALFSGEGPSSPSTFSRFSLNDYLFFQEGDRTHTCTASSHRQTPPSQNQVGAGIAMRTASDGRFSNDECQVVSPSSRLASPQAPLLYRSSEHPVSGSSFPTCDRPTVACPLPAAHTARGRVSSSSPGCAAPSSDSSQVHEAVQVAQIMGSRVAIQPETTAFPVLQQLTAPSYSAAADSSGAGQLKTSQEELLKQSGSCSEKGALPETLVKTEETAKAEHGRQESVTAVTVSKGAPPTGSDEDQIGRGGICKGEEGEMDEGEFIELVFGSSSTPAPSFRRAPGTGLQRSYYAADLSQPKAALALPPTSPLASRQGLPCAGTSLLPGQKEDTGRLGAKVLHDGVSKSQVQQDSSLPWEQQRACESVASPGDPVTGTGNSSAADYAASLFAQSPPRSLEDALGLWARAWEDYNRLSRQRSLAGHELTYCPAARSSEGAHEEACRSREEAPSSGSDLHPGPPPAGTADAFAEYISTGAEERADVERKNGVSSNGRFRADSRAREARESSRQVHAPCSTPVDSCIRKNGSSLRSRGSSTPCTAPWRSPHVCHGRSCDMWELPQFDLYLCRDSGQSHCCGARCDRLVPSDIDLGFLVCPVSGLMVDPSLISAWKAKECQSSSRSGTSVFCVGRKTVESGDRTSAWEAGGDWIPGEAVPEDKRERNGRQSRWKDLRLRSAELMNELMGATYAHEQQQGGTEDDADEMAGIGGMWGRFWAAGYMAEDESELPKLKRCKYP